MRRLDVHLRADERFDTVIRAVKAAEPIDYCVIETEQQDRRLISVMVRDGTGQFLMDSIQSALEGSKDWRVTILPIEATAPKLESVEGKKQKRKQAATREEIFADVASGAELTPDFMIMVVLSTIVAAIGLNSDGIAAVIGAMVIAPLLGPILGFSMGAALGDYSLLRQSGFTLTVGVSIALAASILLSFMMPVDFESRELMSRAEVRLDGVALALAAGGAAALSLTRGAGMALVGVMVAAALLPPGAAIGLFLGSGEWDLALRAGLLLGLNIACLVLSALVVMYLKKIRPRKWIEQKNADRAIWINAALAAFFLVVAISLIVVLDLGAKVSIG
jgi:uncharacterized hydrophobic protein (TIGR00341 family)